MSNIREISLNLLICLSSHYGITLVTVDNKIDIEKKERLWEFKFILSETHIP